MRKTITCLTALFAFSPIHSIHAIEFFDPIDGALDMGEYLAENAYGFLPVPIVITEPAVGYGAGFTGVFLHESDEQRAKRKKLASQSLDGGAQLLTPAITAAGGFFTENGTWMGFIGHRRTWDKDSVRYLGGLGYGDVNMTFYPKSTPDILAPITSGNGVEFGMKGGGGLQKLQFRLDDTNFFLGASHRYYKMDLEINSHPKADDILQNLANTSPSFSGFGIIGEYDSRNSFLDPTQGYNYTAEFVVFDESIGSDYDFSSLNVKGINYWELSDDWSLALKGLYKSMYSNDRFLPPSVFPDIELRGIARNRYQGDETLSVESQVTWQWAPRWSTNVFGGVGYAASEEDSLFSQDERYSYGFGFRYLIARRYGLKSGIDFAFSEEDSAVYFQVGAGI
ncbi:glyceraldehyde-3-phosphate dehydrogenase [Vibrio profundi]|uniref:glyceraldehyde-3-phosphate dehydrogenase n=1 Tax=Vibrio profundi TaxID=1774960 RepID=UPI0037361BC0